MLWLAAVRQAEGWTVTNVVGALVLTVIAILVIRWMIGRVGAD